MSHIYNNAVVVNPMVISQTIDHENGGNDFGLTHPHHQVGGKDELMRMLGKVVGFICCCGIETHIPDDSTGVVVEFARFSKVLQTGTHAYNILTESVIIVDDITVPEHHRGVLLRDKKIVNVLSEGKHHVNPVLHESIKVIPLIVIQENTVGIVTKNGVFSRVLTTGGSHRECHCVSENQKGIKINRGCFEGLLEPGQYFENPVLDIKILVKNVTIIEEGHVGLKCVNGRLESKLIPGVYFENHLLNERITDVNMQVQTKELKAQTIVTKDTVSIQVFSVLVYQIVDAYRAVCLVQDIDFSIRETIKTVTHQVLSEADLDSIMVQKRELSEVIKQRVESCCEAFGVQIDRIDIKDIVFGDELKEALTASAIAKRMAESKLINAQAEVNAARLMRETADLLATDAAMSIRSQETLMSICKGGNAKVYFFGDSNMINMGRDKITRETVKRHEMLTGGEEE